MALARRNPALLVLAQAQRASLRPSRRSFRWTPSFAQAAEPGTAQDPPTPTTVVESSLPEDPPGPQKEGYFFVDAIFPVRLGQWDFRHYLGLIREDHLIRHLRDILGDVRTHGFKVLDVEPYPKDGGAYVRFRYSAGASPEDGDAALAAIQTAVRTSEAKHGAIPHWAGAGRAGNIWLVKGRPWREDLNRFSSPFLRVVFEGPDLSEEALYDLLRPYGRIESLEMPGATPAGVPRAALARFAHLRSAAAARNTLHGVDFQPIAGPSGAPPPRTRLRTAYQPPVQAHAIRDWLGKHPRIVAPVALFLLGSLTYTVWDPIRTFMIEGKVMDWFDYRHYDVYQWLHTNVIAHIPFLAASVAAMDEERRAEAEKADSPGAASHARTRRPRGLFDLVSGDTGENVWQERRDAEDALTRYLNDLPSTVAFLHGPQGSGKHQMVHAAIEETGRRSLVIDCSALVKNASDAGLVNALAAQTGYWPVFTFLNSFNTWIDLASVGLIGQKAGLATSLSEQVQQVLSVTGAALAGVSASYRTDIAKHAKADRAREVRVADDELRKERVRAGEWHDPRLDAVAGNGIAAELGIGDERVEGLGGDRVKIAPLGSQPAAPAAEKSTPDDVSAGASQEKEKEGWRAALPSLTSLSGASSTDEKTPDADAQKEKEGWRAALPSLSSLPSLSDVGLSSVSAVTSLPSRLFGSSAPADAESPEQHQVGDAERRRTASVDAQTVQALPILIIRGFAARSGANKNAQEVLDVIARWAAALAENQVAHVVVTSDNRENAKTLARALPTKPLNAIALSDADPASALSYVKQQLQGVEAADTLDASETAHIERLGGRTRDLESLIHKVRNGQSVQDAVEDIIRRDTSELRKNAFGDDAEDAKSLPWTREQAWQLLKRLTKQEEAPYYDVLVDMFKNDESALRNMEHAELISIVTDNGRPSAIRPGKPVYKYVFERLVSDSVFRATQELAINDKAIASAESTIKSCEEELLRLHEMTSSRAVRKREDYLLEKLRAAQMKVETVEKQSVELKKVLAKGG